MMTSPADTLVCDSAQLAAFRSDAAYDYNRELITPEINIFEWLTTSTDITHCKKVLHDSSNIPRHHRYSLQDVSYNSH